MSLLLGRDVDGYVASTLCCGLANNASPYVAERDRQRVGGGVPRGSSESTVDAAAISILMECIDKWLERHPSECVCRESLARCALDPSGDHGQGEFGFIVSCLPCGRGRGRAPGASGARVNACPAASGLQVSQSRFGRGWQSGVGVDPLLWTPEHWGFSPQKGSPPGKDEAVVPGRASTTLSTPPWSGWTGSNHRRLLEPDRRHPAARARAAYRAAQACEDNARVKQPSLRQSWGGPSNAGQGLGVQRRHESMLQSGRTVPCVLLGNPARRGREGATWVPATRMPSIGQRTPSLRSGLAGVLYLSRLSPRSWAAALRLSPGTHAFT